MSSIKRAVYFGGSKSLEEGLHVERTEMLTVLQTDDGQGVMIDYLGAKDADGELPIYKPGGYVQAPKRAACSRTDGYGHLPGE